MFRKVYRKFGQEGRLGRLVKVGQEGCLGSLVKKVVQEKLLVRTVRKVSQEEWLGMLFIISDYLGRIIMKARQEGFLGGRLVRKAGRQRRRRREGKG